MIIDDKFAYWAFGEYWTGYKVLDLDIIDMMHAWNELHPEKFDATMEGVFDNLLGMRKIYDDLHREETQ